MSYVYGALAAFGGVVLYANLPTKYTIGYVVPAASYLLGARIKTTDKEANEVKIASLASQGPLMVMAVRRPGCMFCRREAAHLSELKPEMDQKGVKLIAVVHEMKGVEEFKPFFKGEVYFDEEKRFYGPNQRWLPLWMGFLRVSTYINLYKTKKEGFQGNTEGEGRLLGGVYLLANNELKWAHLEKEWGDAADIGEVRDALKKFL